MTDYNPQGIVLVYDVEGNQIETMQTDHVDDTPEDKLVKTYIQIHYVHRTTGDECYIDFKGMGLQLPVLLPTDTKHKTYHSVSSVTIFKAGNQRAVDVEEINNLRRYDIEMITDVPSNEQDVKEDIRILTRNCSIEKIDWYDWNGNEIESPLKEV